MISYALIGIAIFTIYLGFFRNFRVCDFRLKVLSESAWIDSHHIPYDNLPSYEYMVFHFWVWPMSRFLP